MIKPTKTLIARENIKQGNMVVCLWKYFCRNLRANDFKNIEGVAFEDCKKGKKVRIFKSVGGLYEADIKK